MGKEFELKYRAGAADQDAILSAFPGAYDTIPMTTSYFDTPDGSLTRLRWTLRHRQEGERQVCTLKTPGDHEGRGEWETDCADISSAIPMLLAKGAPAELEKLTRNGVKLICGARFLRRCRMISGEGFTAELALDAGILLGGGREIPLCEVELELKEGSREALIAFSDAFAARFRLEPEHDSKFVRAAALAKEV